jgi:hypothetical protein
VDLNAKKKIDPPHVIVRDMLKNISIEPIETLMLMHDRDHVDAAAPANITAAFINRKGAPELSGRSILACTYAYGSSILRWVRHLFDEQNLHAIYIDLLNLGMTTVQSSALLLVHLLGSMDSARMPSLMGLLRNVHGSVLNDTIKTMIRNTPASTTGAPFGVVQTFEVLLLLYAGEDPYDRIEATPLQCEILRLQSMDDPDTRRHALMQCVTAAYGVQTLHTIPVGELLLALAGTAWTSTVRLSPAGTTDLAHALMSLDLFDQLRHMMPVLARRVTTMPTLLHYPEPLCRALLTLKKPRSLPAPSLQCFHSHLAAYVNLALLSLVLDKDVALQRHGLERLVCNIFETARPPMEGKQVPLGLPVNPVAGVERFLLRPTFEPISLTNTYAMSSEDQIPDMRLPSVLCLPEIHAPRGDKMKPLKLMSPILLPTFMLRVLCTTEELRQIFEMFIPQDPDMAQEKREDEQEQDLL